MITSLTIQDDIIPIFEYVSDDGYIAQIEQVLIPYSEIPDYCNELEYYVTIQHISNGSFAMFCAESMIAAIRGVARKELPLLRQSFLVPQETKSYSTMATCAWCGFHRDIYRFIADKPHCFDCVRAYEDDE